MTAREPDWTDPEPWRGKIDGDLRRDSEMNGPYWEYAPRTHDQYEADERRKEQKEQDR